jgi:hypothetical protein
LNASAICSDERVVVSIDVEAFERTRDYFEDDDDLLGHVGCGGGYSA